MRMCYINPHFTFDFDHHLHIQSNSTPSTPHCPVISTLCFDKRLSEMQCCIQDRALRRAGRAAAAEFFFTCRRRRNFNRRAERRRRRNFWPPPAQIGGVAENATVAERQSMIFLSTIYCIYTAVTSCDSDNNNNNNKKYTKIKQNVNV